MRNIHSQNVTHYDIKADNILISLPMQEKEQAFATNPDAGETEPNFNFVSEDDLEIAIGDFGECKIFSNDKDEFCTRTRGTDCIKSPEML